MFSWRFRLLPDIELVAIFPSVIEDKLVVFYHACKQSKPARHRAGWISGVLVSHSVRLVDAVLVTSAREARLLETRKKDSIFIHGQCVMMVAAVLFSADMCVERTNIGKTNDNTQLVLLLVWKKMSGWWMFVFFSPWKSIVSGKPLMLD